MSSRIQGNVVVITGASSGIGRATAIALAECGARLVLTGRRRETLEKVAAEIGSRAEIHIVPLDVTDQADFGRLVECTERTVGPIDIVVASAGQYIRGNAATLSEEDFQRSMEVNFYGVVRLALAVLPGMLKRSRGHIVAVSSVDGKKALPLDAPYAAAKFAVTGFMDALRQDLRGTGVSVSTILPGRVDTPMIANLSVPWISPKIESRRVAQAVIRAIRRRKSEVTVPVLSSRALILAAAVSPGLADWMIRLFRLEGTAKNVEIGDLGVR